MRPPHIAITALLLLITGCSSGQPPVALALGQTSATPAGNLTLHAVDYPVDGSEAARQIADPGSRFAVADIQACPTTSRGFFPNDFHLLDSDNRDYTFWNVQIGAMDPNLTESLLRPIVGVCSRGYLTFQVPPGKRLVKLAYTDGGNTPPTIWQF